MSASRLMDDQLHVDCRCRLQTTRIWSQWWTSEMCDSFPFATIIQITVRTIQSYQKGPTRRQHLRSGWYAMGLSTRNVSVTTADVQLSCYYHSMSRDSFILWQFEYWPVCNVFLQTHFFTICGLYHVAVAVVVINTTTTTQMVRQH